MKIGSPRSMFRVKIPASARVLDVGSGHNPHPRANVVVDKFVDDNFHRLTDIKVLKRQQFINADGENLPFAEKEFDYVICNHVLEHVDHPDRFLDELCRVGKAGYLETPSLLGEHLIPKVSHKWLLLDIDDKIVIVNKERVNFNTSHDFGLLFLDYFQQNSLGYKILQRTHQQLFTVNYEWKDRIDYVLDPVDDHFLKYFLHAWDETLYKKIMPERGLKSEVLHAAGATFDIVRSVFKSRFLRRS